MITNTRRVCCFVCKIFSGAIIWSRFLGPEEKRIHAENCLKCRGETL